MHNLKGIEKFAKMIAIDVVKLKGYLLMRAGVGFLIAITLFLLTGLSAQADIIPGADIKANLLDDDGAGTVIYKKDAFSVPTTGWYDPDDPNTPTDDHTNERMVTGSLTVWEFKSEDGGGDDDFWDLDHGYYYTWYIPWSPGSEAILSAELRFDNIRNWKKEEHDLWVHLLNEVPTGDFPGDADKFKDKDSDDLTQSNEFDDPDAYGGNILLVHYDEETDGFPEYPDRKRDISYTFTSSQLDTLATYLANSQFGIALDSDCHYYNAGAYLRVTTGPTPSSSSSPVPEPGSVFLLGLGLISLAGWQRRLKG